ncbi:DUF3085 domain-containing protein [Vibrio parahaemolyticus]|nr:DUF3085 domain-containing protein [Vibrio parahaemolyticus]
MGIARFSVKNLCEKVFAEYKLQSRNSRGSNPAAEIFIIHNQGLYCIADCKHELSNREASRVYAEGCNPTEDEQWLLNSRELVGGGDFCQSIPPEWVEVAIINEQEFLELDIRSDVMG